MIVVEMTGDIAGPTGEVGRADRLVRLLRILRWALIDPRFTRHIARAELAVDQLAGGGDRLGGDRDAVGAHIGNEADRIAIEIDALVKMLRDPHRPARAE